MAKEWTDEEVQAEIRDAVRIVTEDRDKAHYASLHERFGTKPEDGDGKGDGKTPPPVKDDKKNDPPTGNGKKRRSLWWGDESEDTV